MNQSFWISVKVPADMDPGNCKLKVQFKSSVLTEPAVMYATVEVKDIVIQERKNFPITHWWYPECIYDYYEMKPLGDEFFKMVRPYLENLFDHGNDLLFVPLLNYRKEIMKRPPQLLKVWEVRPGVYKFDWDLVRKLIRMAKEIGFHQFEWSHFWAYSHAKERAASAAEPTRIYTERNGKLETLFQEGLDATGEVFRAYMMQFLPEFKQFLEEEGIKEQSLFHICDEPTDQPADIENYKKAREFLNQIDPSVKVMDAVKGISYSELGLTDYPVPIMYRANEFLEKEIPHWVYYCCSPAGTYMNRFFDTPLWQIRIQGWAFYRLRVMGFLHWGYNYWYTQKASSLEQEYSPDTQIMADLFHDCSCGGIYPFGDPFVVYPGKDGPIDSIRWEVFAESMQDYALLQTLGVNPDDELLRPIVNYDTFPSEDGWVAKSLASLLSK
ncbi:DUF4091 domain-containing protein [Paenibacillus sp. CC-CFT747]|nr:DUF4091 domain-containing protein [Paenibacillus sp. CC-CFT747]